VIVLDTTVLVYAVGAEHPLRTPCRTIVALVRDGVVRVTTTVEVIQEFTHIRSRRRARADAAQLAREYARGLRPLLRPDEEDLSQGIDLFEGGSQIGPFDAVLAAACLRRRWALASADRAFAQIAGLTYLDPSAPAFLEEAQAVGA
jgi:uncharacterized protein